MAKSKTKDMSGTVRCAVCHAKAVHEKGPGTPLVLLHSENCSEYVPREK